MFILLLTNVSQIAYYLFKYKGGEQNASILHEVPNQERDEKRQVHHHEEW
jgi:hypothetical protein